MDTWAKFAIAVVAFIHILILIMEMLAWQKRGPKIFKKFDRSQFNELSTVMAANQGLYNGFLAAGLFWSIIASDAAHQSLAWFFLSCVFIAGVYGAMTASPRILYVQVIPSTIAAVLLWFSL